MILISEWLKLPNEEREKYFNCHDNENCYDIAVMGAELVKTGLYGCERCGGELDAHHHELWGTSDSREPKFCLSHYVEINKNAHFLTGEEMEELEASLSERQGEDYGR